jgi:hypothetical protein
MKMIFSTAFLSIVSIQSFAFIAARHGALLFVSDWTNAAQSRRRCRAAAIRRREAASNMPMFVI